MRAALPTDPRPQRAWEFYCGWEVGCGWEPRGVCEQGYWEFNGELASVARKATLASYFESKKADPLDLAQGRLFTYPDADLTDTEHTKRWADRYFNWPCGILSWTVEEPTVGLVKGLKGGMLGAGLVLQQSMGCESYRDWTEIFHVVLLPAHFRRWWWENE